VDNRVNVGDVVSCWVQGEVVGITKSQFGIKIEIIKRNNNEPDAHCFVPLSAIEPRKLESLNEDKRIKEVA
jgi:hypothetical protein